MKCRKCGTEIKEGNNFCTNCGTAINLNINNDVENNRKKINKLEIIIPIIIVIIVLVGVIIFIKNKNVTETDYDPRLEEKKQENVSTEYNEEEKQENVSTEYNEEEKQEVIEKDLLKEIYSKYPELENTEVIICTNGTDYWLLDTNGKKVYFESLTEFEEAYTKYYKNTETDVKNNSTTNNNDNYSYSNNNESYYNIDSSNNTNESSSINNVNYKYTFSANENVVFKETTSTSPVAYAILKCQYCGNIITSEYITSSEYRKYIFSETTKEYPQYLDASSYCKNCGKSTEAKIECNRVQE